MTDVGTIVIILQDFVTLPMVRTLVVFAKLIPSSVVPGCLSNSS